MTAQISLCLPYPPSSNRYWRTMVTRRGVAMTYVSEEAQQFKREVAEITAGLTPFVGTLTATYRFFRPRRSGDLSNRIKVLEDAMQGTVYIDDKQIIEIHAYRFDDKLRPRVEVHIKPLGLF
jgi:Holliday junction resolvase RusA-like endonuclease